MESSVLESSDERTNGFKLMRLIVDGGTEALRNTFLYIHPGNLHAVLSLHHSTLHPLFKTKKKIITQQQWDKLYPQPPKTPNIKDFDITLLVILLRNICGLSFPSTGWNVMPSSTVNSREANIVRIKLFRNNFFGHVPGTDISKSDFEARWVAVSSALLSLGLNREEINRLKAEECGEEEVTRVRKEWNERDRAIGSKLDRIEQMLEEDHKLLHEALKQDKSPSDESLSECLHQCDFEKKIQLLLKNYTEGTRKWVVQQVETWLNDKSSDNRAFIIFGQAGMGKSTIAAVICKLFPEHFAACHFFQYDNDRYNNPRFLLQSLACQLCNVFPEYKQNLANNLAGSKGKILVDMNVKGLFSMLFEEPFTNIADPGKHFLIVIDALNECRQEEIYDFVNLITNHLHKFPRFIRFLITTRPEKAIVLKFQGLNPMFLEPDNERNLNDLRLFFEDELKTTVEHVAREELVKTLVEKSEGLMLYAFLLCKLSKDSFIKSNIKSLPRGIEKIYESHFDRLENELKILGIEEEIFLTLLSMIAVAKQPLHLAIIEGLLSFEKDSLSAQKTVSKIISRLSSHPIIKNDHCVSFFHKSVKDWLVKSDHKFSIIEKYGDKTLADICVNQMVKLKKEEVGLAYDLAVEYALQYGIPHMLRAEIRDMHFLSKLIDHVTDLEIVHASVCIDVYTTLDNLVSLSSHNMYNSFSEKTQAAIKTLINIIRKFTYILKDAPQSFLQHVVNERNEELSPKASELLMTRYRQIAYFESEDEQESIEKAVIGRILTEHKVLDVDISPSEDFLVCGYEKRGVELFSLSDFKRLWKMDDIVVERSTTCHLALPIDILKPPRCIVFHPLKNIIFPGQLNRVLNLEGKFESGLIIQEEIPTNFTNCCFSHDNTKMVTNIGIHLTVWNLRENKKIVSLSCRSELFSMLFSANDRFIGTTNIDEFCVYDAENSYSMISRSCCGNFEVLVSTFYTDSWYCFKLINLLVLRSKNEIVKYDLTNKPVPERFIILWPTNARAAAEFQAVMESEDRTWFRKVGSGYFFILNNGSALISPYYRNEIKLLRLHELIQNSKIIQGSDPLLYLRHAGNCSVSVDGRYVYTHESTGILYIVKLSRPHSVKSKKLGQMKDHCTPFVPVTNGVFFCGEIRSPLWKLFMGNEDFFAGTPELWNAEVTKRISSFPELTGTFHCLSVAEHLVACIMESQVCFFDVLKRAIVARAPFPEHILILLREHKLKMKVIACSSLYHVLVRDEKFTYLLQDAKYVDLKSRVFNNLLPVVKYITTACFSPNGLLLAFLSYGWGKLYILDIVTLKISCKFSLHSIGSKLEFVDKEHLLCEGYNNCLCLINVKTCNILTCINVGMHG